MVFLEHRIEVVSKRTKVALSIFKLGMILSVMITSIYIFKINNAIKFNTERINEVREKKEREEKTKELLHQLQIKAKL